MKEEELIIKIKEILKKDEVFFMETSSKLSIYVDDTIYIGTFQDIAELLNNNKSKD
jgi:hypothetical protein